jgi:hypothetical protein
MAINFSNSTPAAPTGGFNVNFQTDGSGNVSAYVGNVPGGSKQTVAPVAGVVTVNVALGSSIFINVNAVITNIILNNPTDGQEITILFAQDGTGHAVTLGTNMLGAPTITTTANKHSCYSWTYNLADTNWYLISGSNM